jgi:predicted nucleic acid-binding protein
LAVIYLVDKSALARMDSPAVRARIEPLLEANEVATCGIIDMEILYSARNRDNLDRLWRGQQALRRVSINDDTFRQAIAIQARLADTGRHRRPLPDLIIAAAAEDAGATVLHYDKDFEIIAEVCDLLQEWVVPQGSI